MKKGFTLIELLAVIVILAIIALIATPIVLSIIEDSKSNANLRSAENYLTAAKQSITNYQMNNPEQSVSGVYKVMKNGNLCKGTIDNDKCNGIEIRVQVSGEKIMPSSITIGDTGDLTNVEGLEINGKNYAYTNGKLTPSKKSTLICELSEGTSKTIGSKYTCHLDSDRTFYVLEATDNNISLIMDRNFTDGDGTNNTVSPTLTWCTDGSSDNTACKNITSKEEGTPLKHIQDVFGDTVEVIIPTKIQIENSYTDTMPEWLYGNLSKYDSNMKEIESPFKGIWGYWTSSIHEQTLERAYGIRTTGIIDVNRVDQSGGGYGIRPVITILKSQLD